MKTIFLATLITSILPVTHHLAHADARVGEIKDDEIYQVQRRQKSLRLFELGFGPYFSANVGGGEMLYGASLGKHWEVSTRGEIVADLTGAANTQGSLISTGLGFNLLPMTGNFSPVIGGELGFGVANGRDSSDQKITRGGFSAQANLGLRLFRLSETQMEILGTYTATLSSPSLAVAGVQLRVLY